MNRNRRLCPRLGSLLAVFVILLVTPYAAMSDSAGKKIFIDPLYGGRDLGPSIEKYHVKSKEITLEIAAGLENLFDQKKYAISKSRNEDKFLAPEERMTKANLSNSDIYIAIGVENGTDDITIIYYPCQDRKEEKIRANDLHAIIKKELSTKKVGESEKIATSIASNLLGEIDSKCIDDRKVESFLLNNVSMPSVLISVSQSKAQRIMNEKKALDNFLKNIAESISER